MAQSQQASRDDLAAQESMEIGVIQDFLPEQMSAEELEALVDRAIALPVLRVCRTWVRSWVPLWLLRRDQQIWVRPVR